MYSWKIAYEKMSNIVYYWGIIQFFNSAENIKECRVSAPQPRAAETEAALTDPQVTWASQVAQW